MKAKAILRTAVGIFISSLAVSASTFTFSTPTGATDLGGNPESAVATVVTGTNSITITLSNLLANPLSAAELLSGFSLTITPDLSSAALLSGITIPSSSNLITINSAGNLATDNSAADLNTLQSQWLVTTGALKDSISLSALGTAQPDYTIIGPPDSTGVYSAANSSILNPTHQPVIENAAVFTLNAPGVTESTSVTGGTFYFGSTRNDSVTSVGTSTPEPGTLNFLLGGLFLIAGTAFRRCKQENRF